MKKSLMIFSFFILTLLTFIACSNNVNTSESIAVINVTLDQTDIFMYPWMMGGPIRKITATITPENATNKTVKWKSSALNILMVTPIEDGLSANLTGQGLGYAVITVTTDDGGYTATCWVNVISPY